jgi:predicted ABC-class ATPase
MMEIKNYTDLAKKIRELDGKPDEMYRSIIGSYRHDNFTLHIKYVSEKPGGRSARVSATISLRNAGFPKDVFTPKSREIAARYFIARQFGSKAGSFSISHPGIKGGRFFIDLPGHEVLEMSAVVVGDDAIEIRFGVELPVKRGSIPGPEASEFFNILLPSLLRETLQFGNLDGELLANIIETNEDIDFIRQKLNDNGFTAFIADGSILPRRPNPHSKDIVTFSAPEDFSVTLDVPNRGKIRGMGIPKGITVITGGCSQGKTTLLRALELGVYNNVYGDGREFVVTLPDAVGIRAEEGRRIEKVNISPFIQNIARNINTKCYSSRNAPPAASLAANIMEALEIGTSLLLFDDETLVPNLVGRDARMQALVPKADEPITPLLDILPMLRDEYGISSIIVSGTGDYFDLADTVLLMNNFRCFLATDTAKKIAFEYPNRRKPENPGHFPLPAQRRPVTQSLAPLQDDSSGGKSGRGFVQYGSEFIDVSYITQIVNQSQSRALARGIAMVYKLMDGSHSLKDAIDKVMERVEHVGLDALSSLTMGDLASFRAYELAAVINRMKELKVI